MDQRHNGYIQMGPQPAEFPPRLPRGEPIVGPERAALGKLLRAWYEAGADTALLAAATGRSYGWTWTVLVEAGTSKRWQNSNIVNPAVKALESHIADTNRARPAPMIRTTPPGQLPERQPGLLTDAERRHIGTLLRRRYEADEGIRELADAAGYSYGWTRRLLLAAGTKLRARGSVSHRSRRYG